MEEIWKDIKGYEGLYQISNYGNVKSLDRKVLYSNGVEVRYKSKIRKPSLSDYRLVALSKNGTVRMLKISRLVANHFLPKVKDKKLVNHIDGNKHNDYFENLEWCTHSENIIHAYDNNLNKKTNKVSGVFFEERRNKWASYIYRQGKNIFVGRFDTEKEAVNQRQKEIDKNKY